MDKRCDKTSLWPTASLALAGGLWGTGFLFGKIAFREVTVTENVTFRFVCGAIVLLPVLLRRRVRFREKELAMIVLAAVIGVPVQFLMQFKGLQLTTVSHASLIVGTLPVLLALASVIFLREHLRAREWGILLLSGVGALLIALSKSAGEGPRPTPAGDVLVFVSMLAAVVMFLITKKLVARHSSLEVTAAMIVVGTVLMAGWAEATHSLRYRFSQETWGALAAQGLLATAGAYLAWNWGFARVPASRAGVFLNLEPVVGTLLGVAVLGERLGVMAIIGGMLIVGSAVHFSRRADAGRTQG